MATKKPELPSEVEGLTKPGTGNRRIEDLREQINLLEELKNLGAEESEAYKDKMESVKLYQRSLFDDTQRHLEQLGREKILNEDIEAFKKLAREAEEKATRVRGRDREEKKAAFKEEAENYRKRANNLHQLLKIQEELKRRTGNAFKEYIREAKEAEAASDKWLSSREKHIQVERQLEAAVRKKQEEESKGKTIFKIMADGAAASVEGFGDFADALKDLSVETAAISLFIPGTGMHEYYSKVMGMGAAMDDAYRSMVRAGTVHTPELMGNGLCH